VYIEDTFIVSKVSNLITKKGHSSYEDSKTPTKRVRTQRYYSYYKEIRHNSYIYKVEIEDIDNSDASE
jgi:hypothetical protein